MRNLGHFEQCVNLWGCTEKCMMFILPVELCLSSCTVTLWLTSLQSTLLVIVLQVFDQIINFTKMLILGTQRK